MLAFLALTSSLIASVAAHATFQDFWINGVDQGSYCVRLPASNNPVTSVTTNDIACNAGASPAAGTCSVNPGDTVTVEMHQQPGDRSCTDEAIGGDHYGPINVYMAKVTNASTAVGSSSNWFKIGEMGMPSSNPDYWATEVLNDNCGHFDVKIPTGIAPGNYLLRAEVIALHVASSVGGAQFYMSCIQLNVGGTGTATPATVTFPGAYSAQDPGILINIYQQLNTYAIPGPTAYNLPSPAVVATPWPTTATWNTKLQPSTVPAAPASSTAAGSSSAPASASTTATTAKTTTAVPTTTVSSTAAPTSTSSTGGAAHYAQCGGQGWTGATVCASPYSCVASNAYYSQCL